MRYVKIKLLKSFKTANSVALSSKWKWGFQFQSVPILFKFENKSEHPWSETIFFKMRVNHLLLYFCSDNFKNPVDGFYNFHMLTNRT